MDIVLVSLMSALAGFVDAVVGGGGLVLVPALFATYPSLHPATLLGTNKSASVWGTLFAAWQYNRRVQLAWRALLLASLMAFIGSWGGAYVLTLLSPQYLRMALPALLLALLFYTLWNKQLGHIHAPRYAARRQAVYMALIGGIIGFYDGFFGPGTGSFLVFLLVRVLGFDFLQASAHSKVMNLCSNLAAKAQQCTTRARLGRRERALKPGVFGGFQSQCSDHHYEQIAHKPAAVSHGHARAQQAACHVRQCQRNADQPPHMAL